MRAVLRGLGAIVIALAVTGAGIGGLYLLRRNGVLHAGPGLREALPLQRLAGGSTQPLGRVIAAWLPAGLVAGAALSAIGLARRSVRAALMFAACALLLLGAGALSDSITASDPLGAHLGEQPGRVAIWVAAALVAAGAALPGRIARGRR
jgi:hypothetical protein